MSGESGFRQCVACRKYYPKETLIRITKTETGLVLQPSRRVFGRSAYLCRDLACYEHAVRKHLISRSLRTPVPPALLEQLEEAFHES